MKIPHSRPSLSEEEITATGQVIRSGFLAYGPESKCFEEELAEAVGRKHAVVINNGHSALEIYLESLALPQNSKVVIPSYACAALKHAVLRTGHQADIVDVEEDSLGLGEQKDSAAAVIAVNTFAVPSAAANKKNVLEDCAMGFVPGLTGARSHASLLSFYATKMLTTGQGAALLTDDENLAEQWRSLLQYDNQKTYKLTSNRQLTDLQSAMGRVQLKKYKSFCQRRKELFYMYQEAFEGEGLSIHPMVKKSADQLLFRLPLKVPAAKRDLLISHLADKGIEAKTPIWRPLHQDANLNDKDFPVSTKAQQEIVSLPFYPTLSDDELKEVVNEVCRFMVL